VWEVEYIGDDRGNDKAYRPEPRRSAQPRVNSTEQLTEAPRLEQ